MIKAKIWNKILKKKEKKEKREDYCNNFRFPARVPNPRYSKIL